MLTFRNIPKIEIPGWRRGREIGRPTLLVKHAKELFTLNVFPVAATTRPMSRPDLLH